MQLAVAYNDEGSILGRLPDRTKERAIDERNAVVLGAFNRGLLILGAGTNSIRFSPPLILTREQADIAVKILDEALTDIEKSHRP